MLPFGGTGAARSGAGDRPRIRPIPPEESFPQPILRNFRSRSLRLLEKKARTEGKDWDRIDLDHLAQVTQPQILGVVLHWFSLGAASHRSVTNQR